MKSAQRGAVCQIPLFLRGLLRLLHNRQPRRPA
jgi:hypothetical protein